MVRRSNPRHSAAISWAFLGTPEGQLGLAYGSVLGPCSRIARECKGTGVLRLLHAGTSIAELRSSGVLPASLESYRRQSKMRKRSMSTERRGHDIGEAAQDSVQRAVSESRMGWNILEL